MPVSRLQCRKSNPHSRGSFGRPRTACHGFVDGGAWIFGDEEDEPPDGGQDLRRGGEQPLGVLDECRGDRSIEMRSTIAFGRERIHDPKRLFIGTQREPHGRPGFGVGSRDEARDKNPRSRRRLVGRSVARLAKPSHSCIANRSSSCCVREWATARRAMQPRSGRYARRKGAHRDTPFGRDGRTSR
jgi:hypothetical protein